MPDKVTRIIQISDLHLFSDLEESLLGVKTAESFGALLNLIKKNNPPPDIILLTGDITQDQSEEAYKRLANQISELNVPVYCIPGNHDDPWVMQQIYPLAQVSMQKHILINSWQLILLNSQKPEAVEGWLDESEIEFLSQTLKNYPNQYAIIALHHHPVSPQCAWLENLGLTNRDEFWQILAKFPQVRAVLFGHVHQELSGEKNSIPYFSTPSTCIQFKKNSDQFGLEQLGPAYRLIELFPDGSLKTNVHRVAEYIGLFDSNAKGY